MPERSNERISTGISSVKSEMVGINARLDNTRELILRLEETTRKLVDVNDNVSKLLAVHEPRLELQETLLSRLTELVEKRREETSLNIEKVNDTFSEKMEKLKKELDESIEKHNSRIMALEKFMWIMTGLGVVLNFLSSKLNISSFFTN